MYMEKLHSSKEYSTAPITWQLKLNSSATRSEYLPKFNFLEQ